MTTVRTTIDLHDFELVVPMAGLALRLRPHHKDYRLAGLLATTLQVLRQACGTSIAITHNYDRTSDFLGLHEN